MTTIAIITDQHFGVRNDNQQFMEQYRLFYEKVFFPTLKKENIKYLLILGDTFERRKYTNHGTLFFSKNVFFNPLKEMGIKIFMLVGNHDTFYKNTNEINVPELTLKEYDNIHIIANDAETIEIESNKICMVPWINATNYSSCLEEIKNTKADICCGHFEIRGFSMYRGSVADEGLEPKIFSKFDYTFSGHFHYKSESDGIYYLGSPYQTTWYDYGDERGFHLFNLENRDLVFIENPYSIFKKFVYDDTDPKSVSIDFTTFKDKYVKVVVSKKINSNLFDTFIDMIYKNEPADLSIVDLVVEQSDKDDENNEIHPEDTLTLLNKHIESLNDSTIDNSKLKKMLYEIYVEALNDEND